MRPAHTALGLAAASLVLLAGTPAHAAGGSYVALGDSYSSGTGTRSYLRDGTSCQRSVYAYPSLVARSKGYALNLRACSGATTRDVTRLQLSALGTGTTYVSMTVGGNDAGFSDVLTDCALPAWASNCNRAIDRAQSVIKNQLPARLQTLYSSIRQRAPRARVVVAGYPRLFNGEDCNALTWFSPAEQTRLNSTADLLNWRIASAARAAGFRFTNPTGRYASHAVCADTEWINGLSHPITESYHPNRRGHAAGYAPLVGAGLTGTTVAVNARTMRQARASATRLTAQQRRYALRDRAIKPEHFLLPDLGSARSRTAAARAGVDLSSRASIDAADRRFAAAQSRGH
ncbi:MAG TPA: SGNH/GDSL hydrolase family protein [Actinomycetales bacterium]|nr:SGNH/GDSL hydrolase family protein [Actinomycetales bacterium]